MPAANNPWPMDLMILFTENLPAPRDAAPRNLIYLSTAFLEPQANKCRLG